MFAIGETVVINWDGLGYAFKQCDILNFQIDRELSSMNVAILGKSGRTFQPSINNGFKLKLDMAGYAIEQRTEPYKLSEILKKQDMTIEEVFKFLHKKHFKEE